MLMKRWWRVGLASLLCWALQAGSGSPRWVHSAPAGNYGVVRTIPNPDPGTGDVFGYAVAWGGLDASTAVIGAPSNTVNGYSGAGSVYLYYSPSDPFAPPTMITASTYVTTAAEFGSALAANPSQIVVGAQRDSQQAAQAGAAYKFDAAGNFLLALTNPAGASGDAFGSAVGTLGADVVVGAKVAGNINQSGKAYLLNGATAGISQTFSNPTPNTDVFAKSVAGQGTSTILVGAPYHDNLEGKVFAYDPAGTPSWVYTKTVSSLPFGGQFGWSIATDGNYILIGAPYDSAYGAAYLFDATTHALLQRYVLPASDDGPGYEEFGWSVSIYGQQVLIGAPGMTVAGQSNVGAAYLFLVQTNIPVQRLDNPDPTAGDKFGYAVAVGQGEQFLVAAPLDDSGATDAGEVYLFGLANQKLYFPVIQR